MRWSDVHKRKVQNFLPCKTPTRGPPHLDATGVSTAHSVTYEDPDVHLGHHPLVMRHHHHHHHHHNMELHAKQIHYPSGYPMPRSPPLFICSSPGPDPYRSHDNVYEELEHGPGRDTDSEPPIQSDDDFAEDELSLPGDRSFHKSPSDGGTTVATIYHDRSNGGSSNSAATTASGSTVPVTDGTGGGGHPFAGSVGNTCPSTLDGGPLGGEPVVLPPMYDDRGMMTLPPPAYNHTLSTGHHHHHPHHGHHSHHLNSVNNNSTTLGSGRSNYYSTIDDAGEVLDPVERRNRINAQLSASSGPIGTVSTIFRNAHRGPVAPGGYGGVPPGSGRSRTNPRASDRRTGGGRNANGGGSQLAVISTPQDPSQYIYHEPVFHEGLIYDGCLSHTYSDRSGGSGSTGTGSTGGVAYHPYILPQFTTFRNGSVPGGGGSAGGVPPSSHPAGHSIYSRDSSFGSDSGYSQHTQTSNRSVAGWCQRRPTGQSTTSSNGPGSGGGGIATTVPPKATNAADQQPSSAPPTMVDS
uniref:Uncharacterized protein n=1 Tax=Anopheles culicifacies TaxID=139723 RepID=A0A182M3P0_9DIPT